MLVLRTENYRLSHHRHRNLLGFINGTKIKYVDSIYYALNENDIYGCEKNKMKDLKEI